MWFMRFSMDRDLSLLACGNAQGKVFLYNPHEVWKCEDCEMCRYFPLGFNVVAELYRPSPRTLLASP